MIWCVENDAAIRNIAIYALQTAGFQARGFENGTSFWNALQTECPKLVIIDALSPGINGMELLNRIRGSGTLQDLPVIMVAGQTEYDVIRYLDSGADDCLTKPFGMMEMVSRVKTVLRRCFPKESLQVLRMDKITLYPEKRTVKAEGKPVQLTYKEFELLQHFLLNPGEVFSREQLNSDIWEGSLTDQSRTVDMHIRTLRKKLGSCGNLIETVHNVGYRLKDRKDE